MRKNFFLYSTLLVFLAFFLFYSGRSVCISTVTSNSGFSKEFYYFSPDSPQSNLGQLKSEFETYFSNNNFSYNFQPFTHFVDFHRLSTERRPSFILVPAWYVRKYGKELGLHPILVEVRNGSTSYKKILLVSKTSPAELHDNDIVPLAMTSMGPNDQTPAIKELAASHLINVQQLNIINVPKDLDAILALVLGQVKMALVAQDNLQIISSVNPRITQAIQKLDKSITVSMPVLCYLEGRVGSDDVEKLVNTFKRMTTEKPRNKIMEMLQIDDWQTVTK